MAHLEDMVQNHDGCPVHILIQNEETGLFELEEDKLKELLLDPVIAEKHVCVLAVAGAFRKGKSFLLDFLLRYMNNECTSKVVSCKPAKLDSGSKSKKSSVECYETVFEDTVFFPEGGGQPDDRGTVNGIPVLRVLRQGGEAVHYLSSPVEVGLEVTMIIDWQRRHDHMQQHSGQHLITAIADSEFGYPTLSWYLGEAVSSIELGTPKISEEEVRRLEELTNLHIREAAPVEIKEYDGSDPELQKIRTRGLPDDVVGPVRVVTIQGVDSNMCCGTHVRNLADLQAIKLISIEKGKNNHSVLFFVAGNRVLSYLGECIKREKELNTMLHTNPSEHTTIVQKLQKDLKTTQKGLKEAWKDLAIFEAKSLLSQSPHPKFLFHFRKDADIEYLSIIISEISDENIVKVLTAGEERGSGVLIVDGPSDLVSQVAPKVCEILGGKGGGKTRFTAKVTNLSKKNEALKYLEEFFQLPVADC